MNNDAFDVCLQTPYIHFIYQLMTTFNTRDVVMLECRHVSLSLCSQAVSPDVVCEAIVEVMQRNKWTRAAFVGHSYGTFVLSRMAQLHRPLVESMVPSLPWQCMCVHCHIEHTHHMTVHHPMRMSLQHTVWHIVVALCLSMKYSCVRVIQAKRTTLKLAEINQSICLFCPSCCMTFS